MTQVAYCSYDRFPASKGAAIHIAAFAAALARNFGTLELITVAPSPPGSGAAANLLPGGVVTGAAANIVTPMPPELPAGVTHVPLRADGPNLIERVLCFRRQLLSQIGGRRFDIIHVRSIYEGLPIVQHKRDLCRQLVVEVNGLPSIELKYHYPDVAEDEELLRKLRGQEQRLLEAADLVLTVSEVNAAHLRSRGVDDRRIHVIPNGVDTDIFTWQAPRRWPVPAPVRMLYAGTMSPWQGVLQALEALALCRRDFAAELHLAGESRARQKKEIQQACHELNVTDAVVWHGPVSQAQLALLHHHCDVALAPLRSNDRNRKQGCCPLKVLEAMSSGTPLIASDLEVVRCLARSGAEALLVRPGSGKAIKDAVLRLQADPHLAPQLSAAARRRIKSHFTWQHATQRLLQAYKELDS